MVSSTFTKDERGNNIANYSNEFTFTESYDTDSTPINGIIKDEKSNLVYKREIKWDIYKYIKHTLVILCLLLSSSVKAYSFQSGGIYYDIISKTEVEVVTSNQSYMSEKYTGEIIIPETVTSPYRKKNYKVTRISSNAFSDCPGLTSVTMPNSVRSIESLAFHNCKNLTSVTISNSVKSIKRKVFAECSGLTSIIIPNSVTNIEDYAFYGCESLTSITIPNSVTNIGNLAFQKCTKLTSITIGNSVTNIGVSAFAGCIGLNSITIPNSVTNIGDRAFFWCKGLTSIIIGNSVTSIGNQAFKKCTKLTSIIIPNSVTNIGEGAFQECIGLTSVVIGKGLTDIGNSTFYGCKELKEIYCSATTPPTFHESCFHKVPKDVCKLYVPKGCYSAYLNSDWKYFSNIYEYEGEASVNTLPSNNIKVYGSKGNVTVKGTPVDTPIQIYSISGEILHDRKSSSDTTTFKISKSGTYLVKIGNNTYKVNL